MPLSPNDFHEVNEQDRTYLYPDGTKVTIPKVRRIAVSSSGNHRIDGEGNKKYIVLAGFRVIEFEAENWSF